MAERISVPLQVLESGRGLPMPAYATAESAGLDLMAAESVTLAPLARALVPTGFAIALPAGFEAQIRPRSGLALRQGLTVLNAPGTIDADYRGEVGVILINLGAEPVRIERGDRIAQMVIAAVSHVVWRETASLDATARGEGGFGSTGVASC